MRAFSFVLLFVAIASSSYAQPSDREARALAEELLTLTRVEKNLAELRGQFGKMVAAQVKTVEVPEDMKEKITAFQQQIIDVVFEAMSWDRIKDGYIEIYVSVFSVDELRGLVEFYRSAVGQTYTDKMPLLLTKMMELVQARTTELYPRIQKMNSDFIAEVKRESQAKATRGAAGTAR